MKPKPPPASFSMNNAFDDDEFDSLPDLPLSASFLEQLDLIEQAHRAALLPSANPDPRPAKPLIDVKLEQDRPESSMRRGTVQDLKKDADSLVGESEDSDFLSSMDEDELKQEMTRRTNEGLPPPSLYAQFRRRGFFSITDLTAPTWCEVQYQYGLLGKRYLPVSERPTTIVSSKGKVIKPDTLKAADNQKTMAQGTKIHEALEREIHPVQISIKVATREETWGLRILNMLASLEALLTLGICREMPVMGFIRGFLVVGIIDEIQRRPNAPSLPTTSDITQRQITDWFSSNSASNSESVRKLPTHTLYLSDSKTRKTRSLPKEDACLAGKLQVQAYKLLLDELIAPSCPSDPSSSSRASSEIPLVNTSFSFPLLFSYLNLLSDAPFSTEFTQEAALLIEGNGLRFLEPGVELTLDGLSEIWDKYVDLLEVDRGKGCGTELELVYRWQFAHAVGKKARKTKRKAQEKVNGAEGGKEGRSKTEVEDKEERALALAIAESLVDAGKANAEERDGDGTDKTEEEEGTEELKRAIALSLMVAKEYSPPPPSVLASPSSSARQTELSLTDGPLAQLLSELPSNFVSQEFSDVSFNNLPPSSSYSSQRSTKRTRAVPEPADEGVIIDDGPLELPEGAIDTSAPAPTSASHPSPLSPTPHVPSSSPPTSPTTKSLLHMKRIELQALARARGLPTSGRKADLVNRLTASSPSAVSQPNQEKKVVNASSSLSKRSRLTSPSFRPELLSSGSSSDVEEGLSTEEPVNHSDIIGTLKFPYEHEKLLVHLVDVLKFWLGEREPRGVPIEQTSRCDWCEFKEGCEWREDENQRIWDAIQEKKNRKA